VIKEFKKAKICVLKLDIIDYGKAHEFQKHLVQERIEGRISDHLILLQHKPVITMGRSGGNSNILVSESMLEASGISIYEIERGGDVTYHGPGQLTGYPIMDLRYYRKDVHWYLRQLEEVIIRVLARYNIEGRRVEGYTGVWVGEEKIAAIGVAIKRWVTYHGFAFNVYPNMSHFKLINPCGIIDRDVTSLEKLLGYKVSIDTIKDCLAESFADVFDVETEFADLPIPL